jgi:alkaline phosphatase D
MKTTLMNRSTARPFRAVSLVTLFLLLPSIHAAPQFGNGTKVGEVDSSSAIVWTRLTEEAEARFDQLPILSEGLNPETKDSAIEAMPTDVLPGMSGEVRIIYWPAHENQEQSLSSPWIEVDPSKDHTAQIRLDKLQSGCVYHYQIAARESSSSEKQSTIEGKFATAPAPAEAPPIRFVVTTCQAIRSIDSGPEGHEAYVSMLRFAPNFFVHTGDILYYDKAPIAKSVPQARAKWNLMFAYSHNREFHKNFTSYFIKDDHDTLKDDCWPGQNYGDLTFAQGLEIFREQVPMGEKTYRTFRWGKDVQIWMTENRDFRSSNKIPDGADKTILGAAQLQWLKEGIAASEATYKFLITPGPIVGPDKPGKNDNHSNSGFDHEGQILRDYLSGFEKLYVITGDRHWQYHSIDPTTGLQELGCGPINDEHAFGGNSGYHEKYHKYFDASGGYLGITVENGEATARWFKSELDASGQPAVRHELDL